ncbi:MAG: putative heme-binding domain-containing protein [Verrucomicrobiales bacterium]|jgi:putative heme-binding domain-containing protein
MLRQFLFGLGFILAASVSADDRLVRESEPLSPEDEHAALKVADGFEIQLFAAEPQINKPINIAFDKDGRLWVSSTVEYPYAAKKDRWADPEGSSVADSRDTIKILEDTDGDGRADTVVDFADGLNIPTGVLPWKKPEHKMGCIAWSIPNIWYFADTTGDGKCDLREVLFGPLGFEKDTHGMCSSFRLGPDGWVYATHGFNNTSHATAKDGSEVEMESGNVFRFRPDGSRIEIFSRGQVNPFGLCFDQRGNLYSADCHSSPIYQLLRGATYPHFGKPAGPLGFGPTMIQHTHGSTGICGIAYLHSDVWGADWNDHILIGNPVNSRVNRDQIRFTGSTPVANEEPDFIESDDPWFRPVDLTIGPDGALYIADFYNRIIGHYEVPLDHPGRDRERGRIWRVVKKSGSDPLPPVQKIEPISNAVASLTNPDPFRRRTAAAELQFAPKLDAIGPLTEALTNTPAEDTHLRHVLRMAISEHLQLPGAFAKMPTDDEAVIQSAITVPTADAADFLLKTGAIGFPDRIHHIARYGSNDARAKLIEIGQMQKTGWTAQADTIQQIANGLEEGGATKFRPDLLTWAQNIAPQILEAHKIQPPGDWTQIPNGDSPSPWVLQLRKCADGTDATVLSSLPKGAEGAEQRTGLIRSKDFPAPEKLTFWLCGHRGSPSKSVHEKNFVRLVNAVSGVELFRAYPPRNDVCQKVEWTLSDLAGQSVRFEIIDGDNGGSFAWLGVTRIEPAVVRIEDFDRANSNGKALTFLADLLKISAPADLRDHLRPFLPPAPPAPPRVVSEEDRKKLDAIITARLASFDPAKTDIARGAALFKAHCAVCHQVEGEGGLIGPQLDGIGNRGAERLAEDILDPNRNIDAHFYLTTLTLKDGSTTAGFVQAEPGEVVELLDPTGQARRLPKSQIEKRETAPISLMPPTFGQTLTEAEFHDLLSWILATAKN